MRKRAEHVDRTRRRITEATVRLHTTVGPAATTISGVADEAGVTRLTVYRHFPTEEQLFESCQRHWLMLHPPPDPAPWTSIRSLPDRARVALDHLYRWYRDNDRDLYPIHRDMDALPATARQANQAATARYADALVTGVRTRGRARLRLRAAAGHVVSYWTWRSLAVEQGLSPEDVVELAVRFLAAAPAGRPPDDNRA